MAGHAQEPGIAGTRKFIFKTFRVKELHPTFGAEVEGVDFSNITDGQFVELLQAMAKVLDFPKFVLI